FAALVTHDVPRIGPDRAINPDSHSTGPWLENTPEQTPSGPNKHSIPHTSQALDPPESVSESADSHHFVNRLGLDPFVNDGFDASGDTRPSMTDSPQWLPLTASRTGLVPIHQFMPEAEPIEFCEKLAAIAHAQS
ncbi:MAG: hypothetical protein WCD18_03110, partial [Thermosynechococcaceae cyanobacterium]